MGKLYDDAGNLMGPMSSQKNKGAARYRYYVSSPLRRGGRTAPGTVSRVSAPDIEAAVLAGLREVWRSRNPDIAASVLDDKNLVTAFLDRAVLKRERIDMRLIRVGDADQSPQGRDVALPFKVRTIKRRREKTVPEEFEGNTPFKMRSNKRKRLVLAIAKARRWAEELAMGQVSDVKAIAKREEVSERHVRITLPLSFLSPEIVRRPSNENYRQILANRDSLIASHCLGVSRKINSGCDLVARCFKRATLEVNVAPSQRSRSSMPLARLSKAESANK